MATRKDKTEESKNNNKEEEEEEEEEKEEEEEEERQKGTIASCSPLRLPSQDTHRSADGVSEDKAEEDPRAAKSTDKRVLAGSEVAEGVLEEVDLRLCVRE